MAGRATTRRARQSLTLAIVTSIVAGILPAWNTTADAQELIRRRPWTLFDIFRDPTRDRPRVDQYPDAPNVKRRGVKKTTASRTTRRTPGLAAPGPEAAAVEKKTDARTILVIGDFLGSGLAEGLNNQFAQEANFKIIDRTKGSSGFVREDVYEWDKELPGLVEAEKPVAIVVMMGSNDRQALRLEGESQPVGSEAWNKEYSARTSAFADALEASKVPYLWVGMPAFKSPKMTSDMLAFNDVYKAAAQASKGEFVDIWDGFVDENGSFVSTGPDVNGQPAKLRGADGINLTKAGKAKVAFYVDKPLKKLLGIGGPAAIAPLQPGAVSPGEKPALDRTPPMSLQDPEMDGGSELLGAQPASVSPPMAPSSKTDPTARQIAPEPAPGRADDNSWSRRKAERLPAAAVETTTAISR